MKKSFIAIAVIAALMVGTAYATQDTGTCDVSASVGTVFDLTLPVSTLNLGSLAVGAGKWGQADITCNVKCNTGIGWALKVESDNATGGCLLLHTDNFTTLPSFMYWDKGTSAYKEFSVLPMIAYTSATNTNCELGENVTISLKAGNTTVFQKSGTYKSTVTLTLTDTL